MATFSETMNSQEQLDLVLKAVQTLENWGVDSARTVCILQLNTDSLAKFLDFAKSDDKFTEDQLRRIDLIASFDSIIKSIFRSPSNLRNFASYPNGNAGFDGRSLLEIMEVYDTNEWQRVYLIFKAEMMNPW